MSWRVCVCVSLRERGEKVKLCVLAFVWLYLSVAGRVCVYATCMHLELFPV